MKRFLFGLAVSGTLAIAAASAQTNALPDIPTAPSGSKLIKSPGTPVPADDPAKKLPAAAADPKPAKPEDAAKKLPVMVTATKPATAPTPATTPCPCPCPAVPCCEPNAPRFWLGAEWLFWTVQGNPLPPLITSNPVGTGVNLVGRLSSPTTVVLAGSTRLNDDFRNGLHINAGYWFGDDQKSALEFSYFFLENSRQGTAVASNTTPIIARPLNELTFGGPTATIVAFPGLSVGGAAVTSSNEFEGACALYRRNLSRDCDSRLDLLVGYGYLNMADETTIVENIIQTGVAGNTPVGSRIFLGDSFSTRNTFHGGILGLGGVRSFGTVSVAGRATVGLGNNHRTTTIAGGTIINGVRTGNGILAAGTNIGTVSDDVFSVVPELGLRIGWQACENLRFSIGYDWLLWSQVIRAGDQIDTTVNATQYVGPLVGPARPAVLNRETTVYIHGVSFGADLHF